MHSKDRQILKEWIESKIGCQIPKNALFFDNLEIGGDDCIELISLQLSILSI